MCVLAFRSHVIPGSLSPEGHLRADGHEDTRGRGGGGHRLSFGLIDKEIILKTQEWLRSLERSPCKVVEPSTLMSEQIKPELVPVLATYLLWSVQAPH